MATQNRLEPCQQLSAYRKHVAGRNFLFFRDVMQHWLAVCYQHFGAAYWSHLQGSSSQNTSSWHSSKTA